MPRRTLTRLAPLLAACSFISWAPAQGAPTAARSPATSSEAKTELNELRARIDKLRNDLAQSEESRSEAADQLREGEVAISVASRRLHELGEERATLNAELADLDRQIKALDHSTATEQHQLGRLLYRQYVAGDADAWRLLLAGKDPNQAARDRYFLSRLSQAKAGLTRELSGVAERKRALRGEVEARETQLREIEAAAQQQHAQRLKEQQQRNALLQKIAAKIRSQRKEIGAMQRDEQRLGKLIDGLARIAARKSAGKKAAAKPTRKAAQVGAGRTAKSPDPVLAGKADGAFARLRGKLPAPVAGQIAGRFGAPRGNADGAAGGHWKGLFIRAAQGADVRSVAAGSVVFADWLRGFGNLLIVDHGDDFLSIYAFNEALLHQVGDVVRAGEAVATVGNSGGHAHSGLYFELRYQGQPFDPQKWLRR